MKDVDVSLNKIPPQDAEAEAAVLGAVLLDSRAVGDCLSIIGPDDFYQERNRIIFRAVCENVDSGKPVDAVILSSLLDARGELAKVGGRLYLADLLDQTTSSANVAEYASIVKEKSVLREIIGAAAGMVERAYAGNGEGAAAILDEAQRALMGLSFGGKRNHLRGALDLCKTTFKTIEHRHENRNLVTGLSTGFHDLDAWTSGLHGSELVIIAGRPGMGKTALGVNFAEYAVLSGQPTAIFSLEMSGEALMTRVFSSQTGIDSRRLRRGFIQGEDWPRLVQMVDQVSRTPLFIDDSSTLTPLQLKARARRLKIEKGLSLVVVDYLQLMTIGGKHENREREIAEISRSLKALAKELEIPVVALSQLNRAVENRSDKRPCLADLRESGAIEQDADVILFLYRDEVYNKSENNPQRGIAEVSIGKQRSGPTGTIRLGFDEKCTRFRNLDRRRDEAADVE